MGEGVSFKRYLVLGGWYFLGSAIFLLIYLWGVTLFKGGEVSIVNSLRGGGVISLFGCLYDFIYLKVLKSKEG